MWRFAVAMIFCRGMQAMAQEAVHDVPQDEASRVVTAARSAFDDLPEVIAVPLIAGLCGADAVTDRNAVYCTTRNRIYLRQGAAHAGYLVAHLMGHAVQVRHGIADIALGKIRARPHEEADLRAQVTRQVECLAGFFHSGAGLGQVSLHGMFRDEPFTTSHWGRNPLRIGPRVRLGLQAREAAFQRGAALVDPADCGAGSFGADLLRAAFKGSEPN